MGKFVKTRKLLSEYEKMPFDYDKSINKQVEICNSLIGESGNSGFSASCVTRGLLQKTHAFGQDTPISILVMDNYLYPQSSIYDKLDEQLESIDDWFRKEAKKKLKEYPKKGDAHPAVVAFWKKIKKNGWKAIKDNRG